MSDPSSRSRGGAVPSVGQRYDKPNVPAASNADAELARRSGLSPATQAITFVHGRWPCASTIVGATSPSQLKENIDIPGEVSLAEVSLLKSMRSTSVTRIRPFKAPFTVKTRSDRD